MFAMIPRTCAWVGDVSGEVGCWKGHREGKELLLCFEEWKSTTPYSKSDPL